MEDPAAFYLREKRISYSVYVRIHRLVDGLVCKPPFHRLALPVVVQSEEEKYWRSVSVSSRMVREPFFRRELSD